MDLNFRAGTYYIGSGPKKRCLPQMSYRCNIRSTGFCFNAFIQFVYLFLSFQAVHFVTSFLIFLSLQLFFPVRLALPFLSTRPFHCVRPSLQLFPSIRYFLPFVSTLFHPFRYSFHSLSTFPFRFLYGVPFASTLLFRPLLPPHRFNASILFM